MVATGCRLRCAERDPWSSAYSTQAVESRDAATTDVAAIDHCINMLDMFNLSSSVANIGRRDRIGSTRCARARVIF